MAVQIILCAVAAAVGHPVDPITKVLRVPAMGGMRLLDILRPLLSGWRILPE